MKTSKRRKQAARANGARSQGPKTPEGKRRSSYNAVRHGLMANTVVLINEDRANFEALLNQFVRRFAPLDDVEFGMIEEMASACWRMRRGWAAETELLDTAILRHPVDHKTKSERGALAAAFTDLSADPTLGLLHRYETRLSRMYHRALRNLLQLRQSKSTRETGAQPSVGLDAKPVDATRPQPPADAPQPNESADSKEQPVTKVFEMRNFQTNPTSESDGAEPSPQTFLEPMLSRVIPRR